MKTLGAGMTETTEQPEARVIVGDCREVLRDMIAAGERWDRTQCRVCQEF